MKLLHLIRKDFEINGDVKIKFTLFLFRLGNFSFYKKKKIYKVFYYLVKPFYKFFIDYFLNIELPLNTKVGIGLKIDHGHGLVVNHKSIIGDYVTLKHNTTIGCKTDLQNHCIKQTIIGNNVIIHPHSCVIGVTIGDDSIIGAGSIVVKDVPAQTIVAGNPAKILKTIPKRD